ncbi:hypothetical protein K6119_16275 [Paracrocinitomix mangrovi]|uniref:hypothetical protein n=1 Tax=Paracrocinitomix mangrovi TaxID=2862509 RepID=UPI001C8E6EBB|nr:hypothetical protein [Paracrocinitomix mangrovi]UKN01285.1 hypothetical protein K6119_16275 [Paracrocinitomix mangrovi]
MMNILFKRYWPILVLTIFVGLTSCKKSELKKPADVSVQMDINRQPSTQGHLEFNSGYIRITDFRVEGTRQEGAPVEMNKDFSQGLLITFSPTIMVSELNLDIPQGNYTDLDISFDTFDDLGQPTIQVEGTYTNQSSQTFPVIFEFESSETFSINGESETGEPIIVLDKNIPSNTFIQFDPQYWFDIVTINMWDNAVMVDVQGTMTILINESVNDAIYDLIADRIDDATEATFGN